MPVPGSILLRLELGIISFIFLMTVERISAARIVRPMASIIVIIAINPPTLQLELLFTVPSAVFIVVVVVVISSQCS
jgi:hypothetical protein